MSPLDFMSLLDFVSLLDFMSLLDFVSLLDEPDDIEPELLLPAPDFMSVDDEPAPVPELVAGALLEPPAVGLDGDDDDFPDAFVSLPVLAGVFVSALEPLPPVVLPPAPALDEEPLPELLAPPANADVASIAPATVSAKALIHVFITTVLLMLVY